MFFWKLIVFIIFQLQLTHDFTNLLGKKPRCPCFQNGNLTEHVSFFYQLELLTDIHTFFLNTYSLLMIMLIFHLSISLFIIRIIWLIFSQEKSDEVFTPESDSATTTPKTVVSNNQSPLPHVSPTPSVSSDVSVATLSSERDRPTTPRPRTFSKGVSYFSYD